KVKDELAGKKIRCPACQAVLLVAAAPPAAPSAGDRKDAVVAPKAKQPATVAPDRTEEPAPATRAPAKRSSSLVLSLVLGGVVIVLGLGAAAGTFVFAMGWLDGKTSLAVKKDTPGTFGKQPVDDDGKPITKDGTDTFKTDKATDKASPQKQED